MYFKIYFCWRVGTINGNIDRKYISGPTAKYQGFAFKWILQLI